MAGIQAIANENKTNEIKSASDTKKIKAKKSERTEIVPRGSQPNKQVHTKFSTTLPRTTPTSKERYRV